MKKSFRIFFFSLVFLVGMGMLLLYFFMRRSVPEQAQCIPKNSFLVVTLNVKELAIDQLSGKHLFPEMANNDFFKKEFSPITKAIQNNGGSGLNETADVLAFMYQSGDAAYIGISVSLKDRKKFESLMGNQLEKDFTFHEMDIQGMKLFQYDTTSAVLGWNDKCLLLLYPFGNSSAESTASESAKLLSLTKENSILSNANFCQEELNSFDAGIWLHSEPFLAFTKGGSIFRVSLDDIDYLSLNVEFGDGEIDVRKIVSSDKKNISIPYNSPLLISCDPKNISGFARIPLDLDNKNLVDSYLHLPPFENLPFGDDEIKKLLPVLDGNSSILFHDTMSYDMKYITYAFDDNFNNIEKTSTKKIKMVATSTCFGLKNEEDAKKIISEIAKNDSLVPTSSGWTFSDNGLPMRFFISDHMLTITTSSLSDGKLRVVPDQWEGMDLFFEMGNYLKDPNNADVFFFFPQLAKSQSLLSENFGTLTISQPLINGNTRSSTICLRMKNKKVNALIQLEDLSQRILSGGN